uniref:G_PROTEIN_RECEP_F1_2 domain-containing protein n=1 Tax=Schistosoma curassoni TaxID=6186 RepID=A0A183JEW8_9TREM
LGEPPPVFYRPLTYQIIDCEYIYKCIYVCEYSPYWSSGYITCSIWTFFNYPFHHIPIIHLINLSRRHASSCNSRCGSSRR